MTKPIKYLDPKNDVPFKKIFGEQPELMMSFLNSQLPLPPDAHIKEITYLPNELVPENPFKKDSYVDVRCTDNLGRHFIVEMQMYETKALLQRLLYNTSKVYVRELNTGMEYKKLRPVYGLAILNDVLDSEHDYYYHYYNLSEKTHPDDIITGIEIVVIELPKFKSPAGEENSIATLWLRFLKEMNIDTMAVPSELLADSLIKRAVEICEVGAYTEAEYAEYDRYWDAIRNRNSELTEKYQDGIEIGTARGIEIGTAKGIDIGTAKGIEIGTAKGKAEGIDIGTVKGKAEQNLEVARNMKNDNFSFEQTAKYTGIGMEEFEKL
jgi:predicted transposase/invertase (TIGR01784 family)